MHRAFAIAGALTAALVLYLFIEVQAEPEVEVDPAKIEAARREATAAEAARKRAQPKPTTSPTRQYRVKAPTETKKADRDETDRTPEPIAATGMSYKSISSRAPDLEGKPFVTKVKEARRLYGRRRYEQAFALALELLEEEPNNRRVLRVAVASSCIMFQRENAEKYYERLKLPRDRNQMRRRCSAYGVELSE